jgi:hypothetical protein
MRPTCYLAIHVPPQKNIENPYYSTPYKYSASMGRVRSRLSGLSVFAQVRGNPHSNAGQKRGSGNAADFFCGLHEPGKLLTKLKLPQPAAA